MKIKSARDHLIHAVSIAERVSGKHATLPILSCVLFVVENKKCVVKATNLELGIEIDIPATIDTEGTIAVPGQILLSAIQNTDVNDFVTLETKDGNLKVHTRNSETTIKAQPHDDFPNIPHPTNTDTYTIHTQQFIDGFKSVQFAASQSTVRPELASVYVYTKEGKTYFVATDSFRLAEKIIPTSGLASVEEILIPSKGIPEIVRIAEQIGGECTLAFNENQASFTFNQSVYITSRLTEGSFPDYTQIIPKEEVSEVIVLKQDLLNTLKKAHTFSNKYNQVTFDVSPKNKKFTVIAHNSDVGETTDTVEATLKGEDLSINFNHRYITDTLSVISSDSLSLTFSGVGKPMIIRGVSDKTFLYLVMPMNK